MKFNIQIESVKEEDLPFLEKMFGSSINDWKEASKVKENIKPCLDFGPNDISHHINDLVDLGIKALKQKYK